jgi:hypothetical protein
MVEDYELMPHAEISRLRKELSELKGRNPDAAMQEELNNSIKKLNEHLENMLLVFEEAAQEMRMEDRETEVIAAKIDPLMMKMDEIAEQNKKLAKGIVAVADMVKDLKIVRPAKAPEPIKAAPLPPVMKRPSFPPPEGPAGMPSFQQRPMPMEEGPTFGAPPLPRRPMRGAPPPPPPVPEKKKFSLFGK